VAFGRWPELKATQLIMHAALCGHCGPLLRAAASADKPAAQKEKLLGKLKVPPWLFTRAWLVPAAALMVIVGVLSKVPDSFLAPKFAEFAVSTHRQRAQRNLLLDLSSDSQQTVNEWFRAKSPFPLALPVPHTAPGEERPYLLEGARLMQVRGKTAVFIAYKVQKLPASLMVIPDSVAVASGGVEANFKKVSFHYAMIEGYKVVTWSAHGLTYALVSEEGNSTQRSCMICHSAMRDRDLSQTPTPLLAQEHAVVPFVQ